MIPELREYREEIDQILRMSKQWLDEYGRHAVVLVNPDGALKCVPLSLAVARKEPETIGPGLLGMLEKYDTKTQIIVYGNESNQYCALTILEGESLKQVTRFGGVRWLRKLLRLGSSSDVKLGSRDITT